MSDGVLLLVLYRLLFCRLWAGFYASEELRRIGVLAIKLTDIFHHLITCTCISRTFYSLRHSSLGASSLPTFRYWLLLRKWEQRLLERKRCEVLVYFGCGFSSQRKCKCGIFCKLETSKSKLKIRANLELNICFANLRYFISNLFSSNVTFLFILARLHSSSFERRVPLFFRSRENPFSGEHVRTWDQSEPLSGWN